MTNTTSTPSASESGELNLDHLETTSEKLRRIAESGDKTLIDAVVEGKISIKDAASALANQPAPLASGDEPYSKKLAKRGASAAEVRAAERVESMHKGVVGVFAAIKAEHEANQPAPTVPADSLAACSPQEIAAFERWAAAQRYEMQTHPLHWLFLNERTNAARQGWKAALEFAREAHQPAQEQAEPVARVSAAELRDIQSGVGGVPVRGSQWRDDQTIPLYAGAVPSQAAQHEAGDELKQFENYFCMTLSCDDSEPAELVEAARVAACDAWMERARRAAASPVVRAQSEESAPGKQEAMKGDA